MSEQYFAQIDENNIVTDVRVVTKEFLEANPDRYQGTWVETFFNVEGKRYAGVEFEYLPATQNFREQQPYPSWTWVDNRWQPPVPKPTDGILSWNEEELEWVAV